MIFGGFTPCTLIDYPGKTAAMVYTIGCNFRCPYCHNPELVDETVEDTMEEEAVLAFLEKRRGLLDGVVITGGEPTIHGEALLDFMRRVKEKGFLVKLDTNGTNPPLVARAMREGALDYLAMDLKAPLPAYYRTVGRPADEGALRESIALLLKERVPYEFRTTVVKCLLSEEDIEEMAREIEGAARYYLQQFVPTKILNPQFRKKVTYTNEELERLCMRAAPYVRHCAVRA